jgi:arginyl-tRNA synthetase
MPSVAPALSARLTAALTDAFGPAVAGTDPELRVATRPEFGHFQTNLPLRLAGVLRLPPATIAERLVAVLDVTGLCEPPAIAGQGFVNLTLLPSRLAADVNAILAGDNDFAPRGERVVVDYSGPNVAKQPLVHHLRSTVIGDALCRVLAYTGYEVLRQNHLGDWGTQFGMLIEELLDTGLDAGALDLKELEDLYRQARQHFDTDTAFADRARKRVVALQSGDPATRAAWQRIVDVSVAEFDRVYRRLGILLTPADVAGESSYNDMLGDVVDDLRAAGLLTESAGALCVFLPGFTGRDGSPLPMIVRKSDGGFGYSATDLAALRHRVDHLHADRIVVLTDHRQGPHFDQVFALARAAGWLPDRVRAEHVTFGAVLGQDGRPFKTREGESLPLTVLLDEAEARAGRDVGLGAVKYADLVNDRSRDYTFSLDRMVALTGNTSVYLQYAHARMAQVLARSGEAAGRVATLDHPAEQRLAVLLGRFDEIVEQVADTLQPHRLCGHLYDVATAASVFYEQCPVLKATGDTRTSRLALCAATKQALATGLDLLGIAAPDRM